jgi:hypothetical protein
MGKTEIDPKLTMKKREVSLKTTENTRQRKQKGLNLFQLQLIERPISLGEINLALLGQVTREDEAMIDETRIEGARIDEKIETLLQSQPIDDKIPLLETVLVNQRKIIIL